MKIVACLLCLGFWQFDQRATLPAKAWAAQALMQRSWDRAPVGDARTSPWPWTHTWPLARLSAKSGGVDLIVLAGGSDHALALGPGHLSASSYPGERGNSVIAGHRDTHFRFLRDLAIGESLRVETASGDSHAYTIVGLKVVDARRGRLLLDTEETLLTLVTGYPFGSANEYPNASTSMHYVVTAKKLF